MSKNKLKFVIFSLLFLFFSYVGITEVRAQDYSVSVTNVEGLVYGDKLKDASIEGTSSIPGKFSFLNQNKVLEDIGEVELEIVFTPLDLNNYDSKKITMNGIVEKRRISVVFETPLYKQYDGSLNINLTKYSYSGIINNEVTVKGNLSAILSASYVGEDIGVILSGVEIEGEKKDYYYIDFLEHQAKIYPSFLEKLGDNHTIITLDKDIYVDLDYELRVEKYEAKEDVNSKYTSFYKIEYDVYDNDNELIDVGGNYKISTKIDKSLFNRERLHLFELTSTGEYKEIDYYYDGERLNCNIQSDSSLVFATRDIECELIVLFSGILVFYFIFIIVYRLKNSKMKGNIKY